MYICTTFEKFLVDKVIDKIKHGVVFSLRDLDFDNVSDLYVPERRNVGVYVHVPFCRSICPYCPYYKVVVSESSIRSWLRGIVKEIELVSKVLHEFGVDVVVEWVYFGGGTPSLLPIDVLSEVLEVLRSSFNVVGEVGIEANPLDLSLDKVSKLLELGITKLSIGVQSFQDKYLRILGRIEAGRASEVAKILREVIEETNVHVNVDLMFALPTQTIDDFITDIMMVIDLGIPQVTTYPLILVRGLRLRKLIEEGVLPKVPDLGTELAMLKRARDVLEKHGYRMCTIWSWTKVRKFYETVSNEMEGDYLGFGPGAFSLIREFEHLNIPSIEKWYQAVTSGRFLKYVSYVGKEKLLWRAFGNQLYTGTVDLNYLRSRYYELKKTLNRVEKITKMLALLKYLKKSGTTYKLTWRGHRLAHIFTKVFVEKVPCEITIQAMQQRCELIPR